jgi:hypothetical protein
MTVSLVKKVARNIRYHALPDWIDKQVVVNGLGSVEQDVQQGLNDVLLEQATLVEFDLRRRQLALSKYGILDLEFLIEFEWVWNSEIAGVPLLRQLHLDSPLAEDERGREVQRDILEEISNQISQNNVYILLFLTTERMLDWKKHLLSLPDDYFPRTFLVEDACVTNTNWAWFNKHFYL